MQQVITRFAPSPTGVLHIGSARTALFNWLFAQANSGKFLLRIEDTDQSRSTQASVEAIFEGLNWLGIDWDEEPVIQHLRQELHQQAAYKLLASGAAYKCYLTPEKLAKLRQEAKENKQQTSFISPWRDKDSSTHPNEPYCIRLKVDHTTTTMLEDVIHGSIKWENKFIEDFIILRSDDSPTYNFAVVIDDHDMGITDLFRGDDHINNTARQLLIYQAFEWKLPAFLHLPLILDEDGKKMSKRTSSVGIEEYREAGIPPAALRNYLTRLGWSHGDDEFFTTDQAIKWFNVKGLRKSAARFNSKQLSNLSSLHIAAMEDIELLEKVEQFRIFCGKKNFDKYTHDLALASISSIKTRAKSFADIDGQLEFIKNKRPIQYDKKALKSLNATGISYLSQLLVSFKDADWTHDALESIVRDFCEQKSVGFGRIAQPLRAALTGGRPSPSVIDVMLVLGREETRCRIEDSVATGNHILAKRS